tara:strand:- start:58 stop:1161 length:1104 start_codon:yes stop_codon:yes gene_type:complete
MFNYYNNESLRKLVVGFGNLFNDMYVAKFDKDNNIIEKDRVPLTYGPKEKFIRRIKEVSTISDNTRTRITLPRMGFEMLGMSYDPTRKSNKLRKTSGPIDADGNTTYNYAEVPYLINFGLYTFTRNIEENLQLVEQILPIFAPEFIISMNFSDINRAVNVPIILTSTGISEIYEGDFSETRSITTTFSFIAKTYVYGEQRNTPIIEQADLRFFVEEDVENATPTGKPIAVPETPEITPSPSTPSFGTGNEIIDDATPIDPVDVSDPSTPAIVYPIGNTTITDSSGGLVTTPATGAGPLAINGFYPLYTTSELAVLASPYPTLIRENETTIGYHTHKFGDVTYYMPNGLEANLTYFHGNYEGPGLNII